MRTTFIGSISFFLLWLNLLLLAVYLWKIVTHFDLCIGVFG